MDTIYTYTSDDIEESEMVSDSNFSKEKPLPFEVVSSIERINTVRGIDVYSTTNKQDERCEHTRKKMIDDDDELKMIDDDDELKPTDFGIETAGRKIETSSRVAREADSSSDSSIKTVVIPPPRPKRKPAHPYPRKSPVPYSQSPSSAMEKGTKSPTYVLSPFDSEDQVNRCSSPNSCTSDMQSFDKKNDYATSKKSWRTWRRVQKHGNG
ncbi:hypothetical protein YC2023_025284 [Brassica napus]|uniref:(rape) hypothetical protein n=1 Tax=Brassica napus TaxID=3708 RepID=A0A816X9Z3_BRANA|nr:unnamed protein product [Brassica napus]